MIVWCARHQLKAFRMSRRIKIIDVAEADGQLFRLIQEVERDGAIIRIMRRGSPVAILRREDDDRAFVEAREKAITEMERLLKRGMKLSLGPFDRDDLYDR